ncbi:MAG: hypothetical protein HPY65_18135 [Syntrophaceae bacterium]|nr:hypothetical protein [Syntrophaceae bacterium]
MPERDKKPSEREIYELWWEYLKRSDNYKIYCESQPYPVQIIKNEDRSYSIIEDGRIVDYELGTPENERTMYIWSLQRNYEFFGDIFNSSFNDWWKNRKKRKDLRVLDLNDQDICTMLPEYVNQFRRHMDSKKIIKTPEDSIRLLTKAECSYVFVAVPMVGNITIEDISKQIADIRLKWKKDLVYRVADYIFKRFAMPISRVRYEELKRYLKVYDLQQQGLKIKEIAAMLDPKRTGEHPDIQRSFRSDLQKARNIIRNVELGIFPEEPILVPDSPDE